MSPKVAVHGQRKKEDTRAIVPVCAMPFDNFLSTGTCIAPRHCHDIIISQKPKLCKFFAIKMGQIFLKINLLLYLLPLLTFVFFFLCFPKALKNYFKHLCVCRTFVPLWSCQMFTKSSGATMGRDKVYVEYLQISNKVKSNSTVQVSKY